VNLSYFDYAEELTPPLKSTENGALAAIEAGYEHRFGPRLPWASVFASFSPSSTEFDGSTNSPVMPVVSTTANHFLKLEGRVGIAVGAVDLYAGLGYRYWLRRLDYDEYYSWGYGIFGLRYLPAYGFVLDNLRVGLDFSLRPTFDGKLQLENYEAGVETAVLNLKERLGARIELPVQYRFSPRFSLTFSPWYEFSAIGGSDKVTLYRNGAAYKTAREPSSQTHQYGLASFANLELR
jgi:hypothetical protein